MAKTRKSARSKVRKAARRARTTASRGRAKARPAQNARQRSARPARSPARRQRASARPSRRSAGKSRAGREERPAPLDFEAGDERTGRIGDPPPAGRRREQFPAHRVREAGTTAGETARPGRNTADDAAPDTLLDEEGTENPADQRGPRATDTALSTVDGAAIGAGGGTDEAEDARLDPISRTEHKRIKARIARAGSSVNDVEPHEFTAGSPGRERNRRT